MSQQGIFSIAPDAQGSAQNGSTNGASSQQNGSPFASVHNKNEQSSPFAAVSQDSPFQQVSQSAPEERSGIPQPRPNGHLPAQGIAADAPAAPAERTEQPAVEAKVFESSANESSGGPFQMNGFPEQQNSQLMEAAPVAPAMESSPFVAVNNNQPDYEAAKAGLEPQQDFAAVQPRYQVTEPAVQATRQEAPAQQVQVAQAAPVQAVPAPVAPAPQAAPVQQAQPQSFSASVPSNPDSSGFQQLELRAIFGVNHTLTVDEIVQRARTLPGIRNVSIVGADESNALSNFRQALQGMGLGSSHEMKLSSGGGAVDFISEGETTVAVLHEGAYGPGVQETLIIVAREIGKLV